MEPLSGWRTTKSPLAGELVMKCPVMTISLPVDVAVTLWMSKVPKTKQNNHNELLLMHCFTETDVKYIPGQHSISNFKRSHIISVGRDCVGNGNFFCSNDIQVSVTDKIQLNPRKKVVTYIINTSLHK